MKGLTLIAAVALVSTAVAAPASARAYCDSHRCYHRGPVGGPVGAAVGTAAGIAGAAVGTAGAIATAPFRNSYAYDRNPPYWRSNGLVCQPGTWIKGADGRRHLCQ